ncbi:Gfo/Idh/MocA family protein [Sciscionella sediminilitoris]|uniref:Gfo/Idh/MocA family protein n=1 Tax=Sciscionella sediminilitoris TaxID=1445613 RepID=UPI000690D324|nr:Gfo/Idh/MocA family oxidoreductase [Sciscionella sp. SE31]
MEERIPRQNGSGGARPRGAAVLGAGMIAAVHRRAALLAGAEVTGVLASNPERSLEAARQWRTTGYRDIEEVLADERVDVVHICTPNASHAEYAEAALRAGKHVVCEKPLGVSPAQAQRMAELAASTGLVATVPFVYRYHPIVRELRARLRGGELGDRLLLIHGSYLQDWMLSPDASSWRVFPESGGPSRAFADIGSHWCDLVEWITGDPFTELTSATSVAVADRPGTGGPSFGVAGSGTRSRVHTEDSAALLLRTESGVLASATISQVAAGRKNRLWFELDGSTGSAVFDQEAPESIWLGGPEESRIVVRDNGSGSAEQRRLSHLPAGHAQGYAQCFENFVADTYAAIDGATPEGLPGFADGLRSARVVDAVLRSVHEGAWTKVER